MNRKSLRFTAGAVGIALTSTIAGVGDAGATTTSRSIASVRAYSAGDIVDVATGAGQFTTLLAAAQAAGLVDALKAPGPITVFAPTDAAFASLLAKLGVTPAQLLANVPLLTAVLKYHVVPGKVLSTDLQSTQSPTTLSGLQMLVTKDAGGVTINGYAKVVSADVAASNGVIHVVDSVLLPFVQGAPATSSDTIVDVASKAGSFTTLLAAAQAAGLVDALKAPGPITVFAPTDAAFATLIRRLHTTPEKLLANKALLTKVLTYHVVAGRITAADLKRGRNVVTTLNGRKIVVVKTSKGVTVNRTAKVTTADIGASNGVIHVINRVLVPKG
jgi:transforming growth factor-beta-induced protein